LIVASLAELPNTRTSTNASKPSASACTG
jgi:hypothetical protein